MEVNVVDFKAKVQVIYYKKEQQGNEILGKEYATSDKRISIDEAIQILKERNIEFDEVLKVKYEDIPIKISATKFESIIK